MPRHRRRACLGGTTIGSTLQVKYKGAAPNDPYGTSAFTGKVGPAVCAKGRKVTVKGLGSEKTDAKGKFLLTLSGPPDPGKYQVSVAAKDVKDGGGTVTCKKVKTVLTIGKSG